MSKNVKDYCHLIPMVYNITNEKEIDMMKLLIMCEESNELENNR